jgi:restriction endonuclease S subunit
MRNKIVKFADKDIDVKEKKIGELEILVRELFPSTKGKLKNLDKALNDLELDWDLLYKKIPIVFPEITEDDVKNAYMSDLEKLIGAFVDVNFFALKQMIPKLMLLAQTGSQRK